jgi:hypothetical protein
MCFVDAALIALMAGTGTQSTPVLPGGIVAWIICNSRKRSPIGGWLLFYYWQLWLAVVMSAAFFAMNIQSYVRENFDTGNLFALFLASIIPSLLVLLVQVVVATMLLSFRTPDMLRLLRWTLVAQVLVIAVGLAIDAKYYPDNLVLSVVFFVQETLWIFYLFKSARPSRFRSLRLGCCGSHDLSPQVEIIYLDLSSASSSSARGIISLCQIFICAVASSPSIRFATAICFSSKSIRRIPTLKPETVSATDVSFCENLALYAGYSRAKR